MKKLLCALLCVLLLAAPVLAADEPPAAPKSSEASASLSGRFDKKNAFDMERHLRRRPAIVKPDEVFDYYEVDEADLQEDTENE